MVGSRQFEEPLPVEDARILDDQGLLFKRNLLNPVQKDTIRIPRFGAVALRFTAKNPGMSESVQLERGCINNLLQGFGC